MSEEIVKTQFVITVLSRGPYVIDYTDEDPFGLVGINYEITQGDCIGDVREITSKSLHPNSVQIELLNIGNDGSFFETEIDEDYEV